MSPSCLLSVLEVPPVPFESLLRYTHLQNLLPILKWSTCSPPSPETSVSVVVPCLSTDNDLTLHIPTSSESSTSSSHVTVGLNHSVRRLHILSGEVHTILDPKIGHLELFLQLWNPQSTWDSVFLKRWMINTLNPFYEDEVFGVKRVDMFPQLLTSMEYLNSTLNLNYFITCS